MRGKEEGKTRGEKREKTRATAGDKAGGGGKKSGWQGERSKKRGRNLGVFVTTSPGAVSAGAGCDRDSGKRLSRVCPALLCPFPALLGAGTSSALAPKPG